MSSSRQFDEADRDAAHAFVTAARVAGVRRVVYLGGLGRGRSLSEHLRSRREVGEILRGSGIPTIELRASIVIGSGSVVRDGAGARREAPGHGHAPLGAGAGPADRDRGRRGVPPRRARPRPGRRGALRDRRRRPGGARARRSPVRSPTRTARSPRRASRTRRSPSAPRTGVCGTGRGSSTGAPRQCRTRRSSRSRRFSVRACGGAGATRRCSGSGTRSTSGASRRSSGTACFGSAPRCACPVARGSSLRSSPARAGRSSHRRRSSSPPASLGSSTGTASGRSTGSSSAGCCGTSRPL